MLARPVQRNEPILTLRFDHVDIQGNIGPDLSFEVLAQEPGAMPVTTGDSPRNRLIFQGKHPRTTQSALQYRIREFDERYPADSGQQTTSYPLSTALPADGTATAGPLQVRDYDGPDFGGVRYATFQLGFKWWHCASLEDVTHYIASEMSTNAASREVTEIRTLNQLAADPGLAPVFGKDQVRMACKVLALGYFASLVRPGGVWDHKPAILAELGKWTLDAERGRRYPHDVWSNLHFGYVGRKAGFTERELLAGAGLAQSLHDLYRRVAPKVQVLIDPSSSLTQRAAALALLLVDAPLRDELRQLYDAARTFDPASLDNPGDGDQIRAGITFADEGRNADDAAVFAFARSRRSLGAEDAPEGRP